MDYKKNITELAHPESVIISPAHDKLNGLVENDNERHDILLNIVNKPNNGHLTQHKYAQKELLLSLVRVGNALDNQNNDELRILADACLEQMAKESKKISKTAAVHIAIPIILTLASVIGTIYAQQHLADFNEGFETNNDNLIKQINSLMQEKKNWGVGYDLKPEVKDDLSTLLEEVNTFKNLYDKHYATLQNIRKVEGAKKVIEFSKNPESTTVIDAYNALLKEVKDLEIVLTQIEGNFNSTEYKNNMIADKGWMTWTADKLQVLHGGSFGLFSDKFEAVVNAIAPYRKSIQEILNIFANAKSKEKLLQTKLQEAQTKSSMYGSEMKTSDETTSAPTIPTSTVTPENPLLKSLPHAKENKSLDELLKMR
jgi:hypothetical protein